MKLDGEPQIEDDRTVPYTEADNPVNPRTTNQSKIIYLHGDCS